MLELAMANHLDAEAISSLNLYKETIVDLYNPAAEQLTCVAELPFPNAV